MDQGRAGRAALFTAAPVQAIEGFGLEAADVLAGDELAGVATWRGSSDLSALRGRQVAIRLHMGRAKVFAVGM